MSPTKPLRLLSVGTMAAELGVPIHRVTYILRTRYIFPLAMVASYRVYSRKSLEEVRQELARRKNAARPKVEKNGPILGE